MVGALLSAVRPLAPIGAGALWVAQPALGLFVGRDEVARWARFLEDLENLESPENPENPDTLGWLSARLAGEESDDRG